MRRITALLASLVLLLTLVPAAALAAPSATGTWIVTLRDGVRSATAAHGLARQHGGEVGHVYTHALNGFSFRGSQTAASALMRNPNVAMVEADAEVWLDATQTNATWGLDRIDQRDLPLSGTYTYDATGKSVNVYVIDSGIHYGHVDFGGRAKLGRDVVGGIDPAGSDCNGHGTHVAGTIGGATWGVAKEVTLHSVRVFSCSGGSTWETIIAGIDWVTVNAVKPAVANMSLGGSSNSSVDTATRNMINSGVATAVAAGNGNFIGRQADACNYSPARVPEAMTISATNSSDQKASWANYGSCVDWFAPGVSITSAWYDSNTATNTISGTSMASPHTAGVAAQVLQANPGWSAQAVRDAIYAKTTKNKVSSSSTTNNHLLFTDFPTGGGGEEPPPDENTPPTASSFTVTVNEGDTVQITLAGADAETCELAFAIDTGPSNGTLGSPTNNPCTAGSPNTDTATVAYTPSGSSGDSFKYTVTDGDGATSAAATVTIDVVPASDGGSITLSVSAYKVRGTKTADLTWSGATTGDVNVYRDGQFVIATPNNGAYTHSTTEKGGGTHTYQVCETGDTPDCSEVVTVSY